jgi:hypothetical protein
MEGRTGNEAVSHDEVICARMVRYTISLVSTALNQRSDQGEIRRLCAVSPSAKVNAPELSKAFSDFVVTFHRQADRLQELASLVEAAELSGAYVGTALEAISALESTLRSVESAKQLRQISTTFQALEKQLGDIRKAANGVLDQASLSIGIREPRQDQPNVPSPQRNADVTFNILLITDLHWRLDKSEDRWRDVQHPILVCLKDCLTPDHRLDLVLCPGDLAFSGLKDELKRGVDSILEKFWEMFREIGSYPPLLAVPGNHDLRRPADEEEKLLAKKLPRCYEDSRLQKAIWRDRTSVESKMIQRSAQEWSEWRRDNLGLQFAQTKLIQRNYRSGELPGDFSYRLRKGDCTLGIVGLNTTFAQLDGGDYEGKLPLSSSQLHNCCSPEDGREWLSRNDANLLITHHPPSWLHPSCQEIFRNDVCIAGLVDLHLHGHLHTAAYEALGTQPNQLVHRIQGISLFGEEHFFDEKKKAKLKRLHGFVLVELSVAPEVHRFRFRPVAFTDDKRPYPPPEIEVGSDGWTAWEDIPKKRATAASRTL